MSIEGQCHFFTIYFPGLYVLCFTRPRYQVSVYRTIGPLVMISDQLRRSFLRFSIICSMFTRMSKQHFLDINLIVPRLFEEKRRDIVFGFRRTLFLKIYIQFGKIPECVLIPIKWFICCRNMLLGPPGHPFYFC